MPNREPRVFHLITRLLKGGAEAKTMATVLGIEGFEFTVGYGADFHQDQVKRLKAHDIATRRFPLIRHYNPFTSIPAVASVAVFLRLNDFDIVHTHSTEAGIIGRFAAAAAGVPRIVHTVHGIPFSEDRNTTLNRFLLACERQASKYTDRIVTNADMIAKEYLSRGIGTSDQYTTIYSGVNLDEFGGASPAEDLPGTRPRVVMIGRLVEGKGFEELLDAAEVVSDGGVTICLVGDGPLQEWLESQITERGLTQNVFLTGFRDDIPNVLAASDVLVLPSHREGTPRVITEAMASKLPVIATDIAGIPEQVQDGESGYLIQTGDTGALVERLEELLMNEELREKMGQRGRHRSTQFSVEAMRGDICQLYMDLIESQDN